MPGWILRRPSPFIRHFVRTSPFRRPIGRKHQSTEVNPPPPSQSTFQRLWNSPVGFKTVHFWPAEKLSLTQNLALTATGAIWTRWCLIIKPRNVLLAAVNFFLGCVGVVQVSRILTWQQSVKNGTAPEAIEQDAMDAVRTATGGILENPEAASKNAIQ
ncbi:MAG: hypothetical protein L6R35_006112 [Caloplaca aegaea]|nr:MAG: hypothetical protein L6R35_006112 [Caloplaca aegaea]